MPTLDRDGDVFVLDLGDSENRLEPDWIAAVRAHVEEVAAAPAPRALVTTGSGKFFSYGLDLDWIAANPDRVDEVSRAMHELFATMLELPVPTVAALQGHAFAGGGLLALTHDHRVMRADRGWFCLPEVDGRIPFTPGLVALVRARLAPQVAHEALLTGRRYGGEDALRAGIVDAAVPQEELLPSAVALARSLSGKDPATLGAIKRHLYGEVARALRDAEANRGDFERFRWAIEALGG